MADGRPALSRAALRSSCLGRGRRAVGYQLAGRGLDQRTVQGPIVRQAPGSQQRLDHRVFLNDDAKDNLATLASIAAATLAGGC